MSVVTMKFPFGVIFHSKNTEMGCLYKIMNVLNVPELYTLKWLKMIKMATLMLHGFYHNF